MTRSSGRCLHKFILKLSVILSGGLIESYWKLLITGLMGPGGFHHGQFAKKPEGEEDPLEKLMAGTGCLELHYQVQSCIFETGDWRKCQKHVQEFRKCMEEHRKKTEGGSH